MTAAMRALLSSLSSASKSAGPERDLTDASIVKTTAFRQQSRRWWSPPTDV